MSATAFIARAPMNLWRRYVKQLNTAPIQTKVTTSLIAAVLGDCIAQNRSRQTSPEWKYDWARTARLCAFNGMMGCFGHFYYGKLDASVFPRASKSAGAVASKVAIDQLMFSPVCTAFFYLFKCVAEGRPMDYKQELDTKYWPTLLAGWKLWPAAHVINFAFVPTSQRILYMNVVSVAGNYILSRAAAGELGQKKAAEAVTGSTQSKATRRLSELEEEELRHGQGHNEILFDVNVKMD